MAQPGGDYPSAPQPWVTEPKVRFEVIGEAWRLFQEQMGVWIPAILIAFLTAFIVVFMWIFGTAFLLSVTHGSIIVLPLMFLVEFALVCAQIFMAGGLIRIAIKQVRGEPIAIADMFSVSDVFPSLLGGALLVGIAVMVSSMCLVLPGLVVGGMLMLTIPLIVDQKLGAIEALQRSFETFKKEWLMIALFNLVLGIIGELGAWFVVWALFTLPLVFLGQALIYRDFILNPMNPTTPYGNYPIPPGGAYAPPPTVSNVEQPTGLYAPPPVAPTGAYPSPPMPEALPVVESAADVSEEIPVVEAPPTHSEELPPTSHL